MSKKAIGYCRVSGADQEGALITQRGMIENYCKKNDLELIHNFYDTGSSQELESRSGIMRLLEYCAENIVDYVLVTDRSRLSKSIVHAGYIEVCLEQKGITIFGVNQEINDTDEPTRKLIRGVLHCIEEYKYHMDRIKCNQGFQRKKGSGELFYRCPTGYKYNKQDGSLIVHKPSAELIIKAYQLRLENKPISTIAKSLKKHRNTVKNWLQNPFYAGYLVYNGGLIPGKHEPLIPWDTWKKVNPDFKVYTYGDCSQKYPDEIFK